MTVLNSSVGQRHIRSTFASQINHLNAAPLYKTAICNWRRVHYRITWCGWSIVSFLFEDFPLVSVPSSLTTPPLSAIINHYSVMRRCFICSASSLERCEMVSAFKAQPWAGLLDSSARLTAVAIWSWGGAVATGSYADLPHSVLWRLFGWLLSGGSFSLLETGFLI